MCMCETQPINMTNGLQMPRFGDENYGEKIMLYKLHECTNFYKFHSRNKDDENFILIVLGREICIYGDIQTMASAIKLGLRKEHIELVILAQYDRLPLLQYCHKHMKLQTADYCQQESCTTHSVFAMAAMKGNRTILRWLADTLSFTYTPQLSLSLHIAVQEAKAEQQLDTIPLLNEMIAKMNTYTPQ
jgi:hypothetical protein